MRQIEFGMFYAVLPVILALFMPHQLLFPVLLAMTAVGVWLLRRTHGFGWAELRHGRIDLMAALAFGLLVAAVSAGLVLWLAPHSFLALVEHRPGFFLLIVLLYPLLSALPQELLFRVLFFRRYDALLPKGPGRYLLNGVIFSLAHLMFWSWVVAALTFVGGMIFSYAYERRGGFPQAALLHSVAGWMLFAMGMGAFFYLGNAHRPF